MAYFIILLWVLDGFIYQFFVLFKIFDKFAKSSNVNVSPLTPALFPIRVIASSISSFVKSSYAEFFNPFASVFLL